MRPRGCRHVETENRPTVALFLGAGFSKSWGLPLASEIMSLESVQTKMFPGRWQRTLLNEIQTLWEKTTDQHKGVIDNFARLLHGSDSFQKFVSFLALRLSSEHWHVGTARETKWGTGDHVRRQKSIPSQYSHFLDAFRDTQVLGIVTTNYDIVIEKLLGPRSSGRLSGFNYGISEEPLLGRHAVSSQWTYGPITTTGKVPLLKLHGSLNWALSAKGEIEKYIDCRPSRGQRYDALLLPPAGSAMLQRLRPTWDRALEILSNSEVWVFCGYSLPDYDIAVRDLLAKGASGVVSKVCVCDLNPASVREKLSALLGELNRSVRIEDGPGITENFDMQDVRKLSQLFVAA